MHHWPLDLITLLATLLTTLYLEIRNLRHSMRGVVPLEVTVQCIEMHLLTWHL
jgi:hypothetical protein